MTPLHIAASTGSAEIVMLLLDAGANVNARTFFDSTPLSFAVVNNHPDVMRILRENGGIE
jgi:ankyrin repeat protein